MLSSSAERTRRSASALDRLMPLLHNYSSGGALWRQNAIHEQQVLARNAPIAMSSAMLWELAQAIIAEAVERGFLPSSPSIPAAPT